MRKFTAEFTATAVAEANKRKGLLKAAWEGTGLHLPFDGSLDIEWIHYHPNKASKNKKEGVITIIQDQEAKNDDDDDDEENREEEESEDMDSDEENREEEESEDMDS
eukprot:804541_1